MNRIQNNIERRRVKNDYQSRKGLYKNAALCQLFKRLDKDIKQSIDALIASEIELFNASFQIDTLPLTDRFKNLHGEMELLGYKDIKKVTE